MLLQKGDPMLDGLIGYAGQWMVIEALDSTEYGKRRTADGESA
ncbi:MAG: hypothetical protein VKM17_02860 [Cyanobacteriota bacterium]|nr:hypothetical protein [Cyanobacteriota bacterium]